MSSVGSARHDGGGGWWQRNHERAHERRDQELDRRYHALDAETERRHHALEQRLRSVERAMYVFTGVLAATTLTAIFNLVANLAGA